MKTLRILPLLALLLVAALPVAAQNVSISPMSGHLLMANTASASYNVYGAEYGFRSLWRHDQLPLTLMTGNTKELTPGGELANPVGNIVEDYQSEDGAQIDQQSGTLRHLLYGGTAHDLFISVSLPKGFYITGYRMVLLNNCNAVTAIHGLGGTGSDHTFAPNTKTVYETNGKFNTANGKYFAKSETMGETNDTREYVVERTSTNGGRDMRNHIYFHVHRTSEGNFWAFTIKSFTLYFTAEGSTEITVAPLSAQVGSTNNAKSPFETGRPTLGTLEPYTTTGNHETYLTYKTENVHSLVAHNVLYQGDAVGSDGTITSGAGNIIQCWNDGHLINGKRQAFFRYGLKNGVYYVETPTHAYTSGGGELPLGLRITGAKIHYTYGTRVTAGNDHVHDIIRYTATDGTNYYLSTQGLFSRDRSQAQTWIKDKVDENSDIVMIHTPKAEDDTQLWLTVVTHGTNSDNRWYTLGVTNDKSLAKEFRYKPETNTGGGSDADGDDDVNADAGHSLRWVEGSTVRYVVGNTTETEAIRLSGSTTEYVKMIAPATIDFEPTPYTLKVYDKTGTTVTMTKNVDSGTADGVLTISGRNNDAIKFEICDLASGLPEATASKAHALIYVTLTVEALNPYINRMDIVCHNPALDNLTTADNTKLTQEFTADDFKVRGGAFTFYAPTSFFTAATNQCEFTFENLFSRYGDSTYPGGSAGHNSRYYFKLSPYDTRATGYQPDAAASTKTSTTQCYSAMFKPNNLDALTTMTSGTEVFREWGFDDDKITNQHITSGVLQLTSGETANRMLVVTDEPRYSIGLLAGHHRSYAYYSLGITLQARDYTPAATWTKIYDTTLYDDGANVFAKSAKWGVEFNITDTNLQPGEGYVTLEQVRNLLNATGNPALKDILYVDLSKVASILYSHASENETSHLVSFRETLASNALVFLPADASSTGDNFCCKKGGGEFRATNDIVLTDKQPFFTPYNIQLSSENYARYTRLISADKNGKVSNATIMMPFTIEVDSEGEHKNSDNTAFKLYEMQKTGCLSVNEAEATTCNNYFSGMEQGRQQVSTSKANWPYMLQVTQAPEALDRSFVLEQRGAMIDRTPHQSETDYTVTGETTSGTFGNASLEFTALATYSGQELPGSEGTYFYFGKNMLLNSQYIGGSNPSVKVYPFRTYYATSQAAQARAIRQMKIVFGENPDSRATDIPGRAATGACSVSSSDGSITVTAAAECHVRVTTVTGTTAAALSLKPGETRTVALPAGIYVVDGRKVTVSK